MALSPMMQEYRKVKDSYPDCVLMYRVGDFYEMFFEDALKVSQLIGLTLTGKECGLPERAPMCGVPFHALDEYVDRLIKKGEKVAICDQVEDPKLAKGLVKREVTRIVTPGTNLIASVNDETKNNYLVSIVATGDAVGVAACDVATGEFTVTEEESVEKLEDEIYTFAPSEIICNNALLISGAKVEEWKGKLGVMVSALPDSYFSQESCLKLLGSHFHVATAEGLGLSGFGAGISAAGSLLSYLLETQMTDLSHITEISPFRRDSFLRMDSFTMRNLELIETMRDKEKRGSLFGVLDRTKTAMGSRFLRGMIEKPLLKKEAINERLDAVEALKNSEITRAELREYLAPVYDLERLSARIAYGTANPHDLLALKSSMDMVPAVHGVLKELEAGLFEKMYKELDTLEDLSELIGCAISEDAPITTREGGIFKDGYSSEVDGYRGAMRDGKEWLAQLEAKEREATGIHTLRVKFSRAFGYVIEVTNSFKNMVPDRFQRRQTLVGAERYVTPELKELEEKILGAEERLKTLEYGLFDDLRGKLNDNISRIKKAAAAISGIDALQSLAEAASRGGYVRPQIKNDGKILIKNGRHPVVEKLIPGESFVPNDTDLDTGDNRLAVITGPNMAGKSTYMRQNALIVLMAQMGSFVPADSAQIGLVDRIFTRVGASDDLTQGQSTFMVEMTEMANILRQATSKSLLILDEIGRGTSTFDGLSIAWAVIEYVADKKKIGARTLFATHYHELTELEGKIPGVSNYCIAVKESGSGIVFLRKIIKGGADRSYGIQVARLAGVPEAVLHRAEEISQQLEMADVTSTVAAIASVAPQKKKQHMSDDYDKAQMSLFDTVSEEGIIDEIRGMDLENMTPLDALNELYKLRGRLNNRWKKQ